MERRSSGRGVVSSQSGSPESPRRTISGPGDTGAKTSRSPVSTPGKRNASDGVLSSPSRAGMVTKAKLKMMPESEGAPVTPAAESTAPGVDKNVSGTSDLDAGTGAGGTEDSQVTLNRRGMPARQIKRNRFYFDGDNITDDASWKQARKGTPVKVKQEPVEVDEGEYDSGDFLQTEAQGSSAKAKTSLSEGSNRPTAVEMAQALSSLVKPKQGKAGVSGRQVQVKQETPRKRSVDYTAIATPTKKVETPKATKQTPAKGSRESYKGMSSSTPKGSFTPSGRQDLQKSVGKNESTGKSDRYQHSLAAGIYVPEALKEMPKIKKERDSELFLSVPIEGPSREDKIRMKKEKDRLAREQERREYRREREYQDDDLDFDLVSSSAKERRRNSLSESFSENMIEIPNDMMEVNAKPSMDKKSAQEISLRLRNLLKLPKAHKWVCYEWFYSNIDKVLFEGENDFQICFRESFPQLKARKLTRVEWTKIRRIMGKPRRCSSAFFDEEREELARRRQKIRMIQQRKMTDFNYKELPDEIPLQLVIGTKVTSRLRRPQDGLFTGTIEAVDTSNNTYRITFDRPGIGTHSIPDYEVLSNETPETVSTSSFALKIPRRSFGAFAGGQFKFQNSNLGTDENTGFPKSPFPVDGMLGGFPIRLLDMIVRLSKLLKAKRDKIMQLKELNVEAEKMRSYGKVFNTDFRCRYAKVVVDLSSMNNEMAIYLDGVQQYCLEIAPDHGTNQMVIPEQIQEHAQHEAALIVSNCNGKPNRTPVQGTKALTLITKLASVLLQVKTLSSGDRNLYELKGIKDTLKDIKASLEGKNVQLFQDRIEIPMNRIQAGLTMSANH